MGSTYESLNFMKIWRADSESSQIYTCRMSSPETSYTFISHITNQKPGPNLITRLAFKTILSNMIQYGMKSIEKYFYVPETPTDFSVLCTHSQLASEIICLNRRDHTSQGGLVGSRDVGISRMQLLDTYRGDEAALYFHPHLVNGAIQDWRLT